MTYPSKDWGRIRRGCSSGVTDNKGSNTGTHKSQIEGEFSKSRDKDVIKTNLLSEVEVGTTTFPVLEQGKYRRIIRQRIYMV